jgi:VanZ family protein
MFSLWLGSQHGFGGFRGRSLQDLAWQGLAVAVLLFAVSFVAIAWLPRDQRRTAVLLSVGLMMSWMVAYASSSSGGADPFLAFFQERLGLGPAQADLAVKGVRKLIHFLFYGALALVLSRAALNSRASRLEAVIYALATCLALAVFDEYRQSMAVARTGSPWDVGLDMTGAVAFLCIPFKPKGVRS